MKRILTLIAAMVMVLAAMAQSAGIVLSYNKGKELKFFKSINNAIEEAEVNDTIFFGPGSYSLSSLPEYEGSESSYSGQITKPLVFIGVHGNDYGANSTRLTGCSEIFLNVDSSVEESKRVFSFEGISFYYNSYSHATVYPVSNIKELKLMNSATSVSDNAKSDSDFMIDNLIIDRCYIDNLDLDYKKAKRVSVNNSRIFYLYGGCNSSFGVATFDHCYFNDIQSNFVGLIQHSLIHSNYAGQDASFENCCYYNESGSASKDECTYINNYNFSDLDSDPSSLGNCNDGTPYGSSGGLTPYTLFSQYPNADSGVDSETNKKKSFVDYDAINKKLTITVKRIGE